MVKEIVAQEGQRYEIEMAKTDLRMLNLTKEGQVVGYNKWWNIFGKDLGNPLI